MTPETFAKLRTEYIRVKAECDTLRRENETLKEQLSSLEDVLDVCEKPHTANDYGLEDD